MNISKELYQKDILVMLATGESSNSLMSLIKADL